MVKEGNMTGNDKYEGFCIDLLNKIATQIGFHYSIRLVPDKMYGVFDTETKQWNGIVKELMDRVCFHFNYIIHSKISCLIWVGCIDFLDIGDLSISNLILDILDHFLQESLRNPKDSLDFLGISVKSLHPNPQQWISHSINLISF